MKLLILVVGILLCQAADVSSFAFFNILVEKVNAFAESVASTFREAGERLKHIMYQQKNKNIEEPVKSERVPKDTRVKLSRGYSPSFLIKKEETIVTRQAEVASEPTTLLSTPQLAALHGKKVESHVISTKDGYLLTIHRIAVDKSSSDNTSDISSGTVLLHHGLLGSSADWILLGPNQSLPYILANVGYDVWMINTRGNYYSRGHIDMKVDCAEYWSFSFHEMGIYDLSATLEYVRRVKKNNEQINFIGHGMGASTLLVLLSTNPSYNEYLKIAIFLAPLVYMNNVKGPLKILAMLSKDDLTKFGEGEFLPQRKVPDSIAMRYCSGPTIYCTNPLFFFSGKPDFESWSDKFISTLLYHVPAGGSMNTILHYLQISTSGKFHKFGEVYAEYSLSEVTVPTAMLSSSDDWLAPVPDVLKLFFKLKTPIDNYVIHGRNISHSDFLWGSNVNTIIFPRVLEYLRTGINNTATFSNEILTEPLLT